MGRCAWSISRTNRWSCTGADVFAVNNKFDLEHRSPIGFCIKAPMAMVAGDYRLRSSEMKGAGSVSLVLFLMSFLLRGITGAAESLQKIRVGLPSFIGLNLHAFLHCSGERTAQEVRSRGGIYTDEHRHPAA